MIDTAFDHIRIVLVQPAGSRNVGSIARVMKNMGLRQLWLVQPQCDYLGDEARHMAVHAAELLTTAQVVATLPEALTGCQRAIATTGRARTHTTPLETPRLALPWLLERSSALEQSALIFGREDSGLTNSELNYAQRCVSIPASPVYPSLNLAQAVAICCYELHQAQASGQGLRPMPLEPQQSVMGAASAPATPEAALAPLERMEGFYRHLETVLLDIGYLYPHTAPSRMQKLRRLFSRALPSAAEVAMLRGILSQVQWAVQHRSNSRE